MAAVTSCENTLYVTVYIATPLRNMSSTTSTKQWTALELTKTVPHAGTRSSLLYPTAKSRPCTRVPAPCSNNSVQGYMKKMCVCTDAQRVTVHSGIVLRAGTKYERCHKFMFITCFLLAVQKVFHHFI